MKKRFRQHSVEYLFYGFIPSQENIMKEVGLIGMTLLSDESRRLSKLLDYLETNRKQKQPREYTEK